MGWEEYGRGDHYISVSGSGRSIIRIDLPGQIDGNNADISFDGDTATIIDGSKEMRFSLGQWAFELDRNF